MPELDYGYLLNQAIILSKETVSDVFVNYYSHIDKMQIEIYKNGWFEGAERDINIEFYTDEKRSGKTEDKQVREAFKLIRKNIGEWK